MNSLFEEEEREVAINQLIIDLISRFYPLSKEEIRKFKSILNFDGHHLIENENIEWDKELIEIIYDKIDWTSIWKIKNIKLDVDFFETYEHKIEFGSIHLSKSICWSDELLNKFKSKFDWSQCFIMNDGIENLVNFRKFADLINWKCVSRKTKLIDNEAIIHEFIDRWDWDQLSSNPNLPLSVDFIQKFSDKLNFSKLSLNPKSIELIFKYPDSKRWEWDKVIANPGIVYDDQVFDFVFYYFKKNFIDGHAIYSKLNIDFKKIFLVKLFASFNTNLSYFLNNYFIELLPWEFICESSSIKLPIDIIEKGKTKLDFNNSGFLIIHRNILTNDFIKKNWDLFNIENESFYNLPLTIDMLKSIGSQISWYKLSFNTYLDWNYEFIKSNFEKFHPYQISINQGVYQKLIGDTLSHDEIIQFLQLQLNGYYLQGK